MTLPKGFGSRDRSSEDAFEKRNRFKPRVKDYKVHRSIFCKECGHLKRDHQGLFMKGRCKICMCPIYRTMYVEDM